MNNGLSLKKRKVNFVIYIYIYIYIINCNSSKIFICYYLGLSTTHISRQSKRSHSKITSCIICVGSTGTGKSSTISKCTRRAVSSGNGRDRITVRCEMYTSREDEQEPDERSKWKQVNQVIWVDTVGWDDTDLEGN